MQLQAQVAATLRHAGIFVIIIWPFVQFKYFIHSAEKVLKSQEVNKANKFEISKKINYFWFLVHQAKILHYILVNNTVLTLYRSVMRKPSSVSLPVRTPITVKGILCELIFVTAFLCFGVHPFSSRIADFVVNVNIIRRLYRGAQKARERLHV
jgi:hypothetical protein